MAIDYRWAIMECCMSLGVGKKQHVISTGTKCEDGEQKHSTRGAVLIVMSK